MENLKKRTLKLFGTLCFISILMICQSCQNQLDSIENVKVEVSFNLLTESNSGQRIAQKNDLNDANMVIITVQEDNGNPTDYTEYELKVHKIGDAYTTRKIALPFGNYKISEFYVLDAMANIIYACPLEGSLLAQNVSDPLPIFFDISALKSKPVEVEVLSSANLNPEDFGLVRFPIISVGTFQFLISVSELGTDLLLAADLTVTSGNYTYSQRLEAIVDNIVTIRGGYDECVISVDRVGYKAFTATMTNSELKQYDKLPLIVELEKENIPIPDLVAYYPFNGNANDESGNEINGTVIGPTLATDRHGNTNSAYSFDGTDDYIEADASLLPTAERTISVWFYANSIDNRPSVLGYGGGRGATSWFMVINANGQRSLHMSCHWLANRIDYYYSNPPIEAWYHWVITINNNGTKMYVNGVEEVSNETFINNTYVNGTELGIGVIASTTGVVPYIDRNVKYFDGLLDDIRIYDRALSADEIQTLYHENGWDE